MLKEKLADGTAGSLTAPHLSSMCPRRAKPSAHVFEDFDVRAHQCLLTFQHVSRVLL